MIATESPPRKVLAIGQSHLAALIKAYATRTGRQPFACTFLPLTIEQFQPSLSADRLDDRIADAIRTGSPELVLLAIAGNEHNSLGLVNHPQPFDFVLPEAPNLPLDAGAQIVPAGLVREVFRFSLHQVAFPILRHLKAHLSLPLFALEPPPPIASAAYTAARTQPESQNEEDRGAALSTLRRKEGLLQRLRERGVAPAALRYKLWRVQSSLLKEFCSELDIEFVPAPSKAQDAEGLLSEPYWGSDATHANAAYGQLVFDNLANRLFVGGE